MKLTIPDLYDLDHTLAGDYLRQFTYPWEALAGIGDMISALGAALSPDEYDHPEEGVWVARDAKVYPTAYLGAPCIIGHKTEVRPGAFIRGNALVGDNCVVGNSTELKNVILFDNVQVPHYNYVGDSILGYKSHMGAGSITSNVKSDKLPVVIHNEGEEIETGREKGRRDARRLCGGRVQQRSQSRHRDRARRKRLPHVLRARRCAGAVHLQSQGQYCREKNDKGEDVLKVIVAENHEEVSRLAADILEETVRANPCCTLGLATGSSPVGMYRELSRRCREEGLDFSRVHSVNLDEYVGLAPTHEQSYRYFMDSNLFDHINIDKANTYVAKGTGDAEANLREFNAVLDRTDIDVQVLGVGPDGHLGFNEPGDTLCDSAHKEVLDESTIDANQRFFASRDDVPRYALTMGMGNILRAKKLLMIVSGHKEDAMRRLLLSERIDPHCPATFLRLHRDAVVLLERSLADAIGYKA